VFERWEERFLSETQKDNSLETSYIAAIDEAGRGSLFGPVTVGGILFRASEIINFKDFEFYDEVNDSKKLKPEKRKDVYEKITRNCIYGVSHVSVKYIDTYNINKAVQYGAYRVIQNFQRKIKSKNQKADIVFAIIDGNYNFQYPALGMTSKMPKIFDLIQGDSICFSVAAASIIAKVTRDALILKASTRFEGYGLEKNMGYGVKLHRNALQEKGATTFHRKTFIKKIVMSNNS